MTPLTYTLLSVGFISLISLVGVISLSLGKKRIKSFLILFVAFASGAMLSAALLHMLSEAFHEIGEQAPLFMLYGIVLFFFIEKFIHWHHCGKEECHIQPVAYLNLVGDGFHNFIDGVIIAAAYLSSIPVGVVTTIAIALHEIPQEFGDFSVLLHSGMSGKKALTYNFLSASAAILGSLIGFVFLKNIESLIPYTIAIAAGGFVYIATADLMPELHKETKPGKMILQSLALVLGILVLYAGFTFMPHEHASEHEHHEHERVQTIFGSGFGLSSCEQITEADVYELCLRILDRDPEEFEAVLLTNKFHQHLGPNNIYGTKMALYAKKLLGAKDHQMQVYSEAGSTPPVSCLNDGIMVGAGSTFGRGLIENTGGPSKLAATFAYNNKSVRLEVKPEKLAVTQKYIADSRKKHGGLTEDYFRDVRKMALFVWENYTQKDLFIVSYPKSPKPCEYTSGNLANYHNSLHNLLHETSSKDEILRFIDEHECVRDGRVAVKDSTLIVTAVWKSNDKLVPYHH